MLRIDLLNNLKDYLDLFQQAIAESKVETNNISIDHICYKCASSEEFEKLRNEFEFKDRFVYQAIISSRRIAYIGMQDPLNSYLGEVYFLELCDQKSDGSQIGGVDHIELIPKEIDYSELVNRFNKNGLIIKKINNHTILHTI